MEPFFQCNQEIKLLFFQSYFLKVLGRQFLFVIGFINVPIVVSPIFFFENFQCFIDVVIRLMLLLPTTSPTIHIPMSFGALGFRVACLWSPYFLLSFVMVKHDGKWYVTEWEEFL